MKQYFLRKRIFAILFLIVVFTFSGFNFYYNYAPLKEEVLEQYAEKKLDVPALEGDITSGLLGRMDLIESYGFVQVLLDKREFNNFAMIRDEEGYLHYASFFRERDDDLFEYAMRVKRLQDYVEPYGTKVLFVVTPSKYDPGRVTLRTGLPANDPNDIVNELLFDLNRLGIETLNLGLEMPNERLSYDEVFFKTDHHWTVPAAYEASCAIVEKLEEAFDEELDPTGYYTGGDESYTRETYYGGMLGSMGRKTGAVFSGVDDFTALWPNFEGDFFRESMTNDGRLQHYYGNFESTFIDREVLTEPQDLYSGSQYSLYLNELRIYESVVNNENPDGVSMFMIRDSYFSPVICFLMPMVGRIDAMWSLEESDAIDIESYIRENRFDYIVIEVYPYNINADAFRYFRE